MKIFGCLLDWLFPPLCLACKERTGMKSLCEACWALCAPPDPAERCRHCFSERDGKGDICSLCKRQPALEITRAFVFDKEAPIWAVRRERGQPNPWAGFAIHQWIRLEWPMPDAVVALPDPDSESLARDFAKLLQRPYVSGLEVSSVGIALKEDGVEEGQELLLIEAGNPIERLQAAVLALSEAFPKRIYLLSLKV